MEHATGGHRAVFRRWRAGPGRAQGAWSRLSRGSAATVVVALLAWGAPVAAQVNTESFRGSGVQDGVSGSVELSFANRTGNTDLLEGGAGVRVGWRGGPRMVLVVGDLSVGKVRDGTTINRGFLHLRGGRDLNARVMAEGFVPHEYDKFARLSARTLVGAGPRLTLHRSKGFTAHLGLSLMAERERLDVPAGGPDPRTETVARASTYLALLAAPAERVGLVNTVYVQPRLGEPDDLRVLEEAALKVGVAGPVSLKVSVTVRYDGAPPVGVKPLDTDVSNRLVWDF